MTAIYTNNFDAETDGALAGWTTHLGAGAVALTAASNSPALAVSGAKIFGRNGSDDSALYTGAAASATQYARLAFRMPTMGASWATVGLLLRGSNDANHTAYRCLVVSSATATPTLIAYIIKFSGGNNVLATIDTGLNPSSADVVQLAAQAVAGTIQLRCWLNDPAIPAAATLTATDASPIATGNFGTIIKAGAIVWTGADNLVFADSAADLTYFYPAGATVNLVGSSCTQAATSSTGAVTVTPPVAGVVNLAGSNCTQAATSSTGAVTVTQAVGTITTESYRNAAIPGQALASLTIPHVVALRMDRSVALSLANQVTDAAGLLTIANAALARGTDYMLASFNADGTLCGIKKYTAT